jgi:hypothetical protein
MAEREGSPFTIPTAVLLLAGAAIGWARYVRPLQSERPTAATETYSESSSSEQHLRARLWQDPFEVGAMRRRLETPALTSRKSPDYDAPQPSEEPAGSKELAKLKLRLVADKKKKILVMPIMASNAPYADDAEWRRRARYAALSALSAAGYVPEDRAHLGYFDIRWPLDKQVNEGLKSLQELFITSESQARLSPIRPIWAYWLTALVSKGSSEAKDGVPQTRDMLGVPYEWFTADTVFTPYPPVYDEVLVLWLDDDKFGTAPRTRMAYLLCSLLDPTLFDGIGADKMEIRIIGPDNSNTLNSVRTDELNGLPYSPSPDTKFASANANAAVPAGTAAYPTQAQVLQLFDRVKWYAPRPTAAEFLLNRNPAAPMRLYTQPLVTDERNSQIRKRSEPQRTICTDDQLLCSIIEELGRRGIDLADSNNHVALVTEFDTFYGRAAVATFKAAVIAHKDRPSSPLKLNEGDWIAAMRPEALKDQVRLYSYLRGLDGFTGAEAAGVDTNTRAAAAIAAAAAASGKEPPPEKSVAQAERPDGPRQFDYIRRITEELREEDRRLWSKGLGGIRAIGVLGTDVYDKLLVLRAMHDAFPHARFFTTDLDNRLLQERELDSTRNLLIASGYGFKLCDSLQKNIPPFRDGYQTALFSSCLSVLKDKEPHSTAPVPRLYEVGRDGAYDISVGAPDSEGDNPLPARPLAAMDLWRIAFVATLMLGAGLLLALPASRYLRRLVGRSLAGDPAGAALHARAVTMAIQKIDESDKREAVDARLTWGGFLALLLLLMLLMRWSFDEGAGKRWILTGGVSLWPTEVLRLVGAFLSVLFLVHAHYALYRSKVAAAARYRLPFPDPPAAFWQEVRKWARARDWSAMWRDRLGRDVLGWEHKQERNRLATACAPPLSVHGKRTRKAQTAHRVPALWDKYRGYGQLASRLGRIVPMALLFVALGCAALLFFGPPLRPIRGPFSDWADRFIFAASLFMMVLMTFFVADATRLCEIFCRSLAGDQTPWDESVVKGFAAERSIRAQDDPQKWPDAQKWPDVQKWLDIQFIADHTQAIGQLILYPFIVLAIMIVAHNPVFDRWEWPIPLILIFGITCAYAVWCVIVLRRTAENARGDALEKLTQRVIQLSASPDPQASARAGQIKLTIEEIKDIRRGAFTPLAQHPLVGAVLIPISGVGALMLIQMLATPR